mmetsp:Transcript_88050/g.155919  ORF Transcript_88050/g.155919 Transcript_88050/m.155919 type:complete len:84 (-) Transcript_88050:36-287(-)
MTKLVELLIPATQQLLELQDTMHHISKHWFVVPASCATAAFIVENKDGSLSDFEGQTLREHINRCVLNVSLQTLFDTPVIEAL